MELWQGRLIKEYCELKDRIVKLSRLLENAYLGLGETPSWVFKDEELLKIQREIMLSYLTVLEIRGQKYNIDLFDEYQKTLLRSGKGQEE